MPTDLHPRPQLIKRRQRPPLQNETHKKIQRHLAELASIAASGRHETVPSEPLRLAARRMHLFFTNVGIVHHTEEEQHAFPLLIEHANERQQHAVRALQKDHARLKSLWIKIAPDLDALARGYRWRNMAAFWRSVDAFVKLYTEHLAAEERRLEAAHWDNERS